MKYDVSSNEGKVDDLHIRLSRDERRTIKRLAGRGTISLGVLRAIRLYAKWKQMVDRAEKYEHKPLSAGYRRQDE